MFSLTRKEQVAVCFLVLSLLVGGVISFLDRRNPGMIEEFRVMPGTPPPLDSSDMEFRGGHGMATVSGRPRKTFGLFRDRLDINLATAERLEILPGIGPKMAQRIIQFREENGPFRSIEDLSNVEGIGDKTLERLRPLIKVE